jgi:Matrixin
MRSKRGAPLFAPVAVAVWIVLAGGAPAQAQTVCPWDPATNGQPPYCRTTTCPLKPNWSPTSGCCPPDFPSFCAGLNPPAKILPLWWRGACVSYDIQKDASSQAPYDVVAPMVTAAFAQWTQSQCSPDAAGHTRVSIDVADLGPVECNKVQYSSDQGNQHVIIFCDKWPCDPSEADRASASSGNTLGLTTVTFDADTGEIYDADTEINGSVTLSVGDTVTPGGYDLASILTHEMGHFLGLAHSGEHSATMFANYQPGSISMRTVTASDAEGLCSIYPPDGTRSVDTSIASSGFIPEDASGSSMKCPIGDPTPRHGFQSQCAHPVSKGCEVVSNDPSDSGAGIVAIAVASLGVARVRRRGAPKRA